MKKRLQKKLSKGEFSPHSLKPSEKFEQQIKRIHDLLEQPGSQITWNDHVPDPDNPSQPRQIDITIRREEKLTLVECRIHKKIQDVKWIEELMGRRSSLKADAVIAVSASGFTEGAIRKAKAFGIILRDILTLTEQEIASWGHLTHVSLTFYEFKEVNLVFFFRPEDGLGVDQIEKYLPASGDQLYGIFETAAKLIEKENLQERPYRLTARLGNDQLKINGRPVVCVEFSANIALRKQELRIPSVVAYDAPEVRATERKAYIEKVELGEFEITSSSNRVWVTVDLSPIEPPPNCKFHSVDFHFTRTITMQGFDIVGPPKMKIRLQEVLLRSAPMR